MKKLYTILFVLFFLAIFNFVYGRPWRVNQIPNGQKFSCANCHVSPQGGGPLNKFGQAVAQLVRPESTQEFWGPALAQMDSDGDGVTNGQELGDPNGIWKAGQPNPGNINLVTNPGDPNSFPTDVAVYNLIPLAYKLYNNYPNPFNPSTNISFDIPQAGNVSLSIYNSLGQLVKTLVSGELSPGRHNFVWDGTDDADNVVASGVYLYKLTAGSFSRTMRMVLLK